MAECSKKRMIVGKIFKGGRRQVFISQGGETIGESRSRGQKGKGTSGG